MILSYLLLFSLQLAVQIKEECDKFGASSDIKNTCVYGGVKKHTQIEDLRRGIEILIATPGRLIDHLEENNTNLKRVTYLVLDEVSNEPTVSIYSLIIFSSLWDTYIISSQGRSYARYGI
jgi:hypothetical protein